MTCGGGADRCKESTTSPRSGGVDKLQELGFRRWPFGVAGAYGDGMGAAFSARFCCMA